MNAAEHLWKIVWQEEKSRERVVVQPRSKEGLHINVSFYFRKTFSIQIRKWCIFIRTQVVSFYVFFSQARTRYLLGTAQINTYIHPHDFLHYIWNCLAAFTSSLYPHCLEEISRLNIYFYMAFYLVFSEYFLRLTKYF